VQLYPDHTESGVLRMKNKVYAIMDVDISDFEGYGEYMRRVSPALKAVGARYLVRGGKHEVLEGDWAPHRFVLVEFSSIDAAEGFYSSPEYRDCKDIRVASSSAGVVQVEGLEGASDNSPADAEETKTAKGYVIFDVKIHDMKRYQEFMLSIKPTIEAAGARYLVRGGEHKVLEGDWNPDRLVVFEFPSVEKAKEFYFSDTYQGGAKKIRDECSSGKVAVVEGVAGDQ
jgi:uncharacterized protein (DUF1330 family)